MWDQIGDPNVGQGTTPFLGAMGKNDCDFWANALQALILAEDGPEQGYSHHLDLQNDQAPQAQIGDKMKHQYQGNQNALYHAATVVARDGNELVTLEGHVGQNLTAPHFHIRESVSGFVQDNDTNLGTVPSRGLGQQVSLSRTTKTQARADKNTKMQNLRSMIRANNEQMFDLEMVSKTA